VRSPVDSHEVEGMPDPSSKESLAPIEGSAFGFAKALVRGRYDGGSQSVDGCPDLVRNLWL